MPYSKEEQRGQGRKRPTRCAWTSVSPHSSRAREHRRRPRVANGADYRLFVGQDDERIGIVEELLRGTQMFGEVEYFISMGLPRPEDDRYFSLGVPSDPVFAVFAEKSGAPPGHRTRMVLRDPAQMDVDWAAVQARKGNPGNARANGPGGPIRPCRYPTPARYRPGHEPPRSNPRANRAGRVWNSRCANWGHPR